MTSPIHTDLPADSLVDPLAHDAPVQVGDTSQSDAAPAQIDVAPMQASPETVQKPSTWVEPSLPSVSVQVYLAASGRRVDQTAGFAYWAIASRLTPTTIPEWEQRWTEFQNRPV